MKDFTNLNDIVDLVKSVGRNSEIYSLSFGLPFTTVVFYIVATMI